MFIVKIIRRLIYSLISDIRKILGTIALIIILFVGFFGSEKYDIKPFIKDIIISIIGTDKEDNTDILNKLI